MMHEKCEVCRGAGRINLPLYHPVSASPVMQEIAAEKSVNTSKEFPCPECGPWAPEERFGILQETSTTIDRGIDDPAYHSAVRQNAAYRLVDALLRGDFIRFETDKDSDTDTVTIRATLGVVSQSRVATLEARVAEHQDVVAREVAHQAIANIDNWGAYYGRKVIEKDHAARYIEEALGSVLRRRRDNAKQPGPLSRTGPG